jgi:hypothetical protein
MTEETHPSSIAVSNAMLQPWQKEEKPYSGKREGMYPARIGGILFLSGMIRIYKIRKKFNRHTICPLLFLNIN